MTDQMSMGELLEKYESTDKLYSGDVVEGTVISSNADEVMVNIKYMADGILPKSELPDQNPLDFVEGQKLSVFIVKTDDGEGNVLLSLTKANEVLVWDEFKLLYEEHKKFEVKIKEAVKGGIVGVYKGASVFIPASQLALSYVENLGEYVGTVLEVELTEYQQSTKKVVASHKIILKAKQAVIREDMLSRIAVGDKISGTVVRVADYGAFVDIGGMDGLVHISQMSWKRIKHPSEVIQVGNIVDVIVLNVDREKEKVSLKLAEIKENPWESVYTNYKVNDVVTGTVTKLMNFGAFVELEEGIEGLVHISELSEQHVLKPSDIVQIGDEIEVLILDIDQENKKMSLSLKAVDDMDDATYEELNNKEDKSHTTLMDLFGDKLKNLKL